jgi:cytochrome c-type protein NapB
MINQKISIMALLLIMAGMLANTVSAAEVVDSLRGRALAEPSPAPQVQNYQRDRAPIPRDYVQQPPLIPHKIAGYRIDAKSNKCLTCHSWSNYRESGATKISQTHFSDREGNDLSNISARRYFCTQCHVPQVDAKPLVENTFEPVRVLKQSK